MMTKAPLARGCLHLAPSWCPCTLSLLQRHMPPSLRYSGSHIRQDTGKGLQRPEPTLPLSWLVSLNPEPPSSEEEERTWQGAGASVPTS